MLLCYIVLPTLTPHNNRDQNTSSQCTVSSSSSRLARVDFLGALLLGTGLLALLLPIEIGGQKVAWTHPLIFALLAVGAVLLLLFAVVEVYVAKEPIFPLRLLRNRNVVLCYFVSCFQGAAQLSVSLWIRSEALWIFMA